MSIEQNVHHPSHYGGKDNPYETIKVIEAWGLDKNFDLGNAIKYISRAGKKDGNSTLQDLSKAQFYLNREVEKLHKYDELLELKRKIVEPEPVSAGNAALARLFKACKALDYELKSGNENAADYGCGHGREYNCQPDECCACKYSDAADCEDCDASACIDDTHTNDTKTDKCFTCQHSNCGGYTIEIPDDIWDAINMVADYFLTPDCDDDYEIGVTDDGALVIAPSSYDWSELEDMDDAECD